MAHKEMSEIFNDESLEPGDDSYYGEEESEAE